MRGSIDNCLEKLKAACHATAIVNLPRVNDVIRWQSKINAWHPIKPDWAKQVRMLIEAHFEQALEVTKLVSVWASQLPFSACSIKLLDFLYFLNDHLAVRPDPINPIKDLSNTP